MVWRSRWTLQVWTTASGNTARIASGKPFRPSTTASRISSTPRFRSSFITRSQNLAPSFCSSQSPRISLVPSARTPLVEPTLGGQDGEATQDWANEILHVATGFAPRLHLCGDVGGGIEGAQGLVAIRNAGG